jgi:Right handed beta helix region
MRTATVRLTFLFMACLYGLGCKFQYSNYCPGALNDNCLNVDAPIMHCASDQECAPQVCDLAGSRTCVQCTSANASACAGPTPVCGADDACRACTAHAECASNACLPDGSCGTDTNVAYVDPAGPGTNCTQLAPCKKVSDAIATGRPFIKFHGVTNEQVILNRGSVTLLADPGATLTDTANGILLKIDGAAQVTIYDLTISGASGPNNPGISLQPGNNATASLFRATVSGNAGGGIVASGGTLTVSRSSILNNAGGGISITGGVFTIVGNVFYNNGGNNALVGGLSVGAVMNPADRLEFNSFVLNTAQDGTGSGIHCLVSAFTARDNVLSDNRNTTSTMQVDGTCAHAYSLFHPGLPPMGTANLGGDPLFVNEAMPDLHLQAGSPARGKADPAADLTGVAARDIDGVARIAPADLGAYQYAASKPGVSTGPDAEGARP